MKKSICLMLILCASLLFAETEIKLYQDMTVTENLRLRTTTYIDNGNEIITVLNAGTRVKIINIGKRETIDGINSNWVQVEVQKNGVDKDGKKLPFGMIGWCFGGYLNKTQQIESIPDYKNGNGTILSRTEDDERIVEVRKHLQAVEIGDRADASQRIIYSDMNKTQVLYELQNDDEMEISEVYYTGTKADGLFTIWLRVQIKGITGYVCYSEPGYNTYRGTIINGLSYPYINNTWEVIDVLEAGNRIWTVRKLAQEVSVFSREKADKVEIRDKPGYEGTQVIGYLPSSTTNPYRQINIDIEAVTEEVDEDWNTRWVRVSYEGVNGWVDGVNLGVERGGPKYYIPEQCFSFSMKGFQ